MFRVYRELTNEKGEIVHRTPVARCARLNIAISHARVWSNGWQMGIYQIMPDGTEVKVR